MQKLTNINELENAINENEEMVVSKNNRNRVIIMSMKEYRKRMVKKDIEKHLLKAEEDIKNGRVRDAKEVFKSWKEMYGI